MQSFEIPIIQDDPWLAAHKEDILNRMNSFQEHYSTIQRHFGSLYSFADRHHYLGIQFDWEKRYWTYREWAPAAEALHLMGDFNHWNRTSHPLFKGENGIWEIQLPYDVYKDTFIHGSLIKVVVTAKGVSRERLPAMIKRAVQNEVTKDFAGQLWFSDPYVWEHDFVGISKDTAPIIYECHVGMAQEKQNLGSYLEFADKVLPRIAQLGYNCIQLMAIQEHPYYGSFGYHVSNFFAPSSRFGTPEDLKYLIDKAHGFGIACILDVVHSHAVKNIAEGLNDFDGSEGLYFYEGERGNHPSWDSKLFDYGKEDVRRFLLSNIRYWMEEFRFDGFRFDGITSVQYYHHGYGVEFTSYDKYFDDSVDKDALLYLQLANTLAHEMLPTAITIAEDYSGMPGACRKIEEGGLGFDYRLAMGIPDFWIKLLKHKKDEDWNVHDIWSTLLNRRFQEKNIAYVESHDQGMVGDKTTAFWLMDKDMYWHMSKDGEHPVIDRGIAMHKMLRIMTAVLGGEGYLNFIGNEFGHPEWLDFPREGNQWSYKYARRQWSLVDNTKLKYHYLNDFDSSMVAFLKEHHILSAPFAQQLNMDQYNQVIICERAGFIFIFNISPTNSVFDYHFTVPQHGKYQVVFNSDDKVFGGHQRIDETMEYFTFNEGGMIRLSVYTTTRTALVLKKMD